MQKQDGFLRKFFTIAIPILLQQVLQNSLNFVDSLMVSHLGETAIAAVGLAGQVNFLINLLFFGISSACSIFIAQFYGAGNEEGIRKITAFAVEVAFLGSTLFCILATCNPEWVMGLFTHEEEVTQSGVAYMRMLGFGFFFLSLSQIFGVGLRATDKPFVPMVASIVSMVSNIILDWAMIFGHLGLPAMAEGGAALATSLSRMIEAAILIIAAYKLKSPCRLKLKNLLVPLSFIRSVLPTCLPVVCNEFFWALGMAIYKVAYAKQGVEAIAAANVTETVANLFTTASLAVSSTALVMIGQKIGERKMAEVHQYCRRFTLLSVLCGAVMGSLFFAMSPLMVSAYNLKGELSRLTLKCMWVTALIMPLRSFDYCMVTGILRSGGDTRYSMLCELACVWLVGIPMAFLSSAILHLAMWQVYLMVYLEEVAKGIFGFSRIKSGKWLKDLTEVK